MPKGQVRGGSRLWLSTMTTNAAIALVVATMMWLVGAGPFLLVQLPVTLLAGSIGVWLFYVQHQFEDPYWARAEGWDRHDAAVHGSSHYCLSGVLRWITANIGIHHVHHLCSGMPFYRLPQVLRDHPELGAVAAGSRCRRAFAASGFGTKAGNGSSRSATCAVGPFDSHVARFAT